MGSVFTLGLPFALVFMALSNQLNWQGFIVGYVFSIAVLWLAQAYRLNLKTGRVVSQVWYILVYGFVLTIDIFWSSVQVARIVLSPNIQSQINPGVLTLDTQDETNNEIVTAMSAHGITITPGEMVIDVEDVDGTVLLHVHNLDIDDSRDTLLPDQEKRLRLIRKVLGYA